MNISFDRILSDLQKTSSFVQDQIGIVFNDGFGIETTANQNQILMYAGIVALVVVMVRIRGAMRNSDARSYDFGRYG
ncbi:hypothetical protein [Oceanomicrobium pacificus]|uniref:Uncharacterized protein n=1 Tax=Oceanomicrobium pacificus TaxID=2692916 RepID=A0A6B0TLQ8_9RHOB|nr:hypothetical protein [Oceanomicrobium pacificus]MXU65467.1 hypothetical protein [Oceanomicrobium pacificus]